MRGGQQDRSKVFLLAHFIRNSNCLFRLHFRTIFFILLQL